MFQEGQRGDREEIQLVTDEKLHKLDKPIPTYLIRRLKHQTVSCQSIKKGEFNNGTTNFKSWNERF